MLLLFLFSIFILLVNGCSDSYPPKAVIKVDIPTNINIKTNLNAYLFKKSIKDDLKKNYLEFEELSNFTKKIEELKTSPNLISKLNGLKLLNDTPEAASIKQFLTHLNNTNSENAWSDYLNRESEPINIKISESKRKLDSLGPLKEQIDNFFYDTKREKEQKLAEIKEIESQIEKLVNASIEAFNKDILEKQLPIYQLTNQDKLFNAIVFKNSDCVSYGKTNNFLTLDRRNIDGKGLCYCLRFPKEELMKCDSSKLYYDNFSQYVILKEKLGDSNRSHFSNRNEDVNLYKQLINIEEQEKNNEIVATNKFGDFKKTLNEYDKSESDIKNYEKKLAELSSETRKQSFFVDYYNSLASQFRKLANDYFNSVLKNICQQATLTLNVEFNKIFDLPSGFSDLIIIGELSESFRKSDEKGYIASYISLEKMNGEEDLLRIGKDDFEGGNDIGVLYKSFNRMLVQNNKK